MIVNYSSTSEEETESSSKDDSSPLRKRGKLDTQTSTSEPLDHGSVKRKAGKSAHLTPRLPLPDSVKEMFREPEEQWIDKSEEHGGRQRSFQHERGNWATYVFCPYDPEEAFLELLNEMVVVAAAHGIPLTLSEEFHVSISKTVVLRHHWIQPFIQSIHTGLTQFQKFFCLADKLRVYSNAEKTSCSCRTFLGMEISTGKTQLLELIKILDETMKEFNLSTFYKDPSFHISLAWCVGDHTERLKKTCLSQMQSLIDGHEDGPFYIQLNCTELRCKSGNKVFLFPLQ
ncbi:U6 snRNA phosphodiesterase-like isoform X1 [Sinocyclocheilus rhinocerous]|uniref:U6 snRNA phosphodiesterase-like isoform X1 n=1 Tax=Sinocyclocheilus rhinocerous TaxID=307959 RepID=UPI0007BAC1DB|nr:PREDICTED: U6 snRNA phosphodiesterase-like isoform X1 [Sinocyclocheilus rhinocerous]